MVAGVQGQYSAEFACRSAELVAVGDQILDFYRGNFKQLQTCLSKQGLKDEQLPLPNNVFRKAGDDWNIRYAGGNLFAMPDAVGLFYIAYLLEHSGEKIPATKLREEHGALQVDPERRTHRSAKQRSESPDENAKSHVMDGGEITTRAALQECHDCLIGIKGELDRARENGDLAQTRKLEEERESILERVKSATGPGGKLKRVASEPKKDADAVRNALNASKRKIMKKEPDLGQHLENSLKLSAPLFSYKPEKQISWNS